MDYHTNVLIAMASRKSREYCKDDWESIAKELAARLERANHNLRASGCVPVIYSIPEIEGERESITYG